MVNVMNNLEMLKRLKDHTYKIDDTYSISQHIGKYATKLDEEQNQWLMVDLFPQHTSNEEGLHQSKKKWEETMHPKLQCIELFSHKYDAPEVSVTKSTVRVRLSNGTFVTPRK